ncbi:MAG: hypothetical protein M1816_004261 [Peltula sp. TS41687]|nr:MAG: hypothetical protein M1816_004261 [Peltula sp. TS41687]
MRYSHFLLLWPILQAVSLPLPQDARDSSSPDGVEDPASLDTYYGPGKGRDPVIDGTKDFVAHNVIPSAALALLYSKTRDPGTPFGGSAWHNPWKWGINGKIDATMQRLSQVPANLKKQPGQLFKEIQALPGQAKKIPGQVKEMPGAAARAATQKLNDVKEWPGKRVSKWAAAEVQRGNKRRLDKSNQPPAKETPEGPLKGPKETFGKVKDFLGMPGRRLEEIAQKRVETDQAIQREATAKAQREFWTEAATWEKPKKEEEITMQQKRREQIRKEVMEKSDQEILDSMTEEEHQRFGECARTGVAQDAVEIGSIKLWGDAKEGKMVKIPEEALDLDRKIIKFRDACLYKFRKQLIEKEVKAAEAAEQAKGTTETGGAAQKEKGEQKVPVGTNAVQGVENFLNAAPGKAADLANTAKDNLFRIAGAVANVKPESGSVTPGMVPEVGVPVGSFKAIVP